MAFIQEGLPPVSDAFLEGRLEMAHKMMLQPQTIDSPEAYATIVSVLLIFFLVFFFYRFREILNLLPILLGMLSNKNIGLNIEHIKNTYRNRNATACIFSIPLGIFIARISLIQPSFLKGQPLGWMMIFTIGFLILYIFIRRTALLWPKPRKLAEDAWKVFQNGWMNYYILGSLLFCAAGPLLILFKVPDNISAIVFLCIFGPLYVMNLVRNIQIISKPCSTMTTILYLCAFEIIPTGALILLGLL